MRGRAFVFGEEVNTDVITPSEYLNEPLDVQVQHLFEPVRPEFTDELDQGDIVVAGAHFGSGSSRETAPAALQAAGVGAVVAESFSRIFYRNAINLGLPPVACPRVTEGVRDGAEVAIDLSSGEIENVTTGETLAFDPLPEAIREIFDAGGLLEHYQQHPSGLGLE